MNITISVTSKTIRKAAIALLLIVIFQLYADSVVEIIRSHVAEELLVVVLDRSFGKVVDLFNEVCR